MKGVKGEEVILKTENKIGKLSEVTKLIKDSGINIRAINAYVIEGEAVFRLVSSDNAKLKKTLAQAGKVDSAEAVIVEMPDETGQLCLLAGKLKAAGIDLSHIYGTTVKVGESANIIFSSNNNDKALKIISAL